MMIFRLLLLTTFSLLSCASRAEAQDGALVIGEACNYVVRLISAPIYEGTAKEEAHFSIKVVKVNNPKNLLWCFKKDDKREVSLRINPEIIPALSQDSVIILLHQVTALRAQNAKPFALLMPDTTGCGEFCFGAKPSDDFIEATSNFSRLFNEQSK